MKEIVALVNAVRRRIYLALLIDHGLAAGFVAVCALAAFMLAAKMVYFPWAFVALFYGALGGAAMAALYALVAARTKFFVAALAADDRLRLAERLSTAIEVSQSTDPFSQVVVEDARERAARIKPNRDFPIGLPRRSWRFAAALAGLALILSLPQYDLFGRQAEFVRKKKDRQEATDAVKKLEEKIAELKKTVAIKDPEVAEAIENIETKLADLEKSALTKKDALAAVQGPLEHLAEKMKEMAQGLTKDAQAKQAELAKASGKALEEAKSALEEAKKALEKGELSEEQKEQLAKALEQAAQKMAEAGGANSEMSQALAKAAKDMQSGSNSEALKSVANALQSINSPLQGLNPLLASSKNQGGQQNPGGQKDMTAAAGQLAGAAGAEEIKAMVDAMKGMGQFKDGLTGTESMSMEEALAQLQAAQSMWASSGRGGNTQGDGEGEGAGMGGRGRGRGNVWNVGPDTAKGMQSAAISGAMHPGRILASALVEGGTLKNESTVEVQETVMESKQDAKQAITDQKVPRAYEKTVREYFDSLEVPRQQ